MSVNIILDDKDYVKVKTITNSDSPYTLLRTIKRLNCDTSGGSITVTLPAISEYKSGNRIHYIKRIGASDVTVNHGG